eukprot:1659294-Amphidinium_carterae.1
MPGYRVTQRVCVLNITQPNNLVYFWLSCLSAPHAETEVSTGQYKNSELCPSDAPLYPEG